MRETLKRSTTGYGKSWTKTDGPSGTIPCSSEMTTTVSLTLLNGCFDGRKCQHPYDEGAHGTTVASVAAGKNLGVAPAATIIPIAQNLTDDQRADILADAAVRQAIALLSSADRRQLDHQFASNQRNEYAKFDIINRSLWDSHLRSRGGFQHC